MASVGEIVRRRHRRQERRQQERTRRSIWTAVLTVAFIVLVVLPGGAAFGGAAAIYWNAVQNLPTPGQPPASETPTQFYDSSDQTAVYTLQNPLGDQGTWVSIDTLPPYVISATLAAEDPTFLTRGAGFNPIQTIYDLWRNVLIGTLPPDPSITGRLVRNAIAPLSDLQGGSNAARADEIALVAEIERRYTPRQILEWHLNTNYYGNEAYGIEAAAHIYFNKRSVDLTLDEAAMLAAIPTATQYNPFSDETAARGRQADLLKMLLNSGAISQDDYNKAVSANTVISRGNYLPPTAPEFVTYARAQAENILNSLGYDGTHLVARGGLKITTTLDLDLYNQSLCVMQTQFARLNKATLPANCPAASYLPALISDPGAAPPDSGALVILDATTGAIKSMVGPANDQQFEPGVTIQPFVYLSGFVDPSARYTPATMVNDIPNQYPGSEEGLIYSITNPDGKFRGPMNLRNAMGADLLPPAADIAYKEGMDNILETAHQLGMNSLDENSYDIMLLERGGQVAPLDVAYSYSVFATLGSMRGVPTQPVARGYRARDPVAIQAIQDSTGAVLWQYDATNAATCGTLTVCTPLLDHPLAYLVNDILSDQSTRWPILGQGSALDLSRPGAVVNGVTDDHVDDWTVGYTPQFVTSVALDRQDGSAMSLDPFGMNGAAPIWRALMEYAHNRDQVPATGWDRPDSVVDALVCDTSGLLPNSICPVHSEIFLDGTQPKDTDNFWQMVEINSQTGQLATVNTPAELRQQARFFVPPPGNVTDWWVANHQPLPPTQYDNVSTPRVFQTVHITRPALFDYVGGKVDVYADIDTKNMQFFQLEYGQGLNPTQWFTIGGQQTAYTAGKPVGTWDTTGLDGLYSLRVAVVLNDNTRQSDAVQVTVDNVPPTITLDSVEAGKIYRWPGDSVVSLKADAQDNLTVSRVEFYHDNELLGADVTWPFTLDWRITGLGDQTFTAIAFDGVGNQASAQVTVQILRAGS